MDINLLKQTAAAMVAPGKGILAADESTKTIAKRLAKIGVESNPEVNLAYRSMLFTTPGIEDFISGVILYDETFRQKIGDKTVPEYLASRGFLPGIKVDQGAWKIANFPGEKVTEGLDGLRDRLMEYKSLGAQFAKWRAVITIGDGLPAGRQGIPTEACIEANADSLGRYAALCQEQDIVPIVEPEVLIDGNHDIQKSREASAKTLKVVFDKLKLYKVVLEGVILKPSMVTSGKACPTQADAKEIARQTVETFLESVPKEVPGIVFLSGGQTPDQATENLAAINQVGGPWQLSFSYGRALQDEAQNAWAGKSENIGVAQKAFYERCQKVSAARSAKPT